jgi:hypothetical protein
MSAAQLSAWFAAHRTVVLGAGAAGVAGLALLRRNRGGAEAPGTVAGTLPAAAVVQGSTAATGGGSYDSSAFDVYNALQPQLEALMQTGAAGGVKAAPKPVASTIFAPSNSGRVLTYSDGRSYELEKDGSLFGLTSQQLHQLEQTNKKLQVTKVSGRATRPAGTGFFNTKTNVARQTKQYG